MTNGGATLLVGMSRRKKQEINKLVEQKAFADTVGIKCADFKNDIFVLDFYGFPCYAGVGKGRRPSFVG